MKNKFKLLALLLAAIMILGSFMTACTDEIENDSEKDGTDQSTESSNADIESESATESSSKTETENVAELEGEYAELIENAHNLANGVNAYFESSKHQNFIFENQEMILSYGKDNEKPQLVESLTNKNGNPYVENTMDVFVRMTDGKTYYASESLTDATANIYRLGYYFYEMRLEEQDFVGGTFEIADAIEISHSNPELMNQVKLSKDDGALVVRNNENCTDPYVAISRNLAYPTDKYNYLKVTIKADALITPKFQLFYIAGNGVNFGEKQSMRFMLKNDGEYHTYYIPLYTQAEYTGNLKGIRFDIDGPGGTYAIKDIQLVSMDKGEAPAALGLNRSFMVYSDKMHHVIQVATTEKTENIAAVGMLTEIPEDKVANLVLEDKNGIRYTLDGADWDSVQYIGFDIIDAGIFGYILPYDGKGGRIEVTLTDGVYKIVQTMTPEGGVINPSENGTDNANDFYMGQRIYTDESHDFTEFLEEAYFERNPLNEKRIKVDAEASSSATYEGYDSLRGIYRFTLDGPTSFGASYSGEPNRHFNVSFDIRGDDKDRMIYILTYTGIGTLECAALLDEDGMMLPIPLEVGKNFSEIGGERNLFNLDDSTYGEVIFPLTIEANGKYSYNILNLYQNWGRYPLKQLSWIQYYAPYYHLSTGVTETNCIIPYYFTKNPGRCETLPDHRSMSAPLWDDQPQHNSCGTHEFLMYTDADGNYYYSENTKNTIDSYGPTYADVKMDYTTTDGKISMSYTHTEMPQTDENRAYYEMTYTVNEDVSFKDFALDFQFYSVYSNDATGVYQKVGYLNADNECTVVDANKTKRPIEYILGDQCPYFSFFDMDGYGAKNRGGYSNVSFIIYESEFIIGGEKKDVSFVLVDRNKTLSLSLDLEEITLKAGDCFKINAIIMPWGSQELEDEYYKVINEATGEQYLDKNVRDVRENTLLNPLTITAGENCESLNSVFVPKARTTNGKSAEFTLSGGENNVAVRIYGFDKLTAPKIYEKIGDEWVVYDVSSAQTPDVSGYYHYYDGYCVYYDGDGTYSYSFVTTMTNGESRTFKIEAAEDFIPWPRDEKIEVNNEDKLNVYLDYEEIAKNLAGSLIGEGFISNYELSTDGYVRLFGMGVDSDKHEGYMFALNPGGEPQVAGKYIVLKYRVPTGNKEKINYLQFYVSTVSNNPTDNGLLTYKPVDQDGEWHVVVIDSTTNLRSEFATSFMPNADGEYVINFLRFDFFNSTMSAESRIDIAYFGMDSDLDKIIEVNKDAEYITYVEGETKYKLITETGEIVDFNGNPIGGGSESNDPEDYIGEGSVYNASDKEYFSCLDMINGRGENGEVYIRRTSGNSKTGVTVFNHNGSTVGENLMIFSGWCVVNGGVSKYVWSVDGGVTWNDTKLSYYSSLPSAGQGVLDSASAKLGITLESGSEYNAMFQGSLNPPDPSTVAGVVADLSDFAGQTVNVTLAAVPETAQDTLCVIAYVKNITVPETGN